MRIRIPRRVSVQRKLAALRRMMIPKIPNLILPSQKILTWARVGPPTAGDADYPVPVKLMR